ncbi:hypothetical protein CDIK_3199 [Cucumispora dikerogammari]|nr:hypothetical protein CDIK_3199 [Cucumispora dikerogammari]
MFHEIMQTSSNIFSPNTYCFSITKQSRLVHMFNIMREDVIKFHDERIEKLKEFDIKFKTLVQEYFPEPRQLWKIKPDDEPMLKTDYLSSNPQLLQHISIKRRMRELFFKDFLSFYYDLFSKQLYKIQINDFDGSFNRNWMNVIFGELNASPKFSKKNAINIEFLDNIWNSDLSFSFLLHRLEEIVSERTDNSTDIIREILYLNPNFKFVINNDQNIRNFYYIIRYYISDYGRKKCSRDPKNFVNCLSRANELTGGFNGIALLTEIVKNYKEYLKIDIEKEFKSFNQSETNPRFFTYTKNWELLKKCCIKENTNLIDVSCEEHQKIVDEIRDEYCGVIGIDFIYENSYFHYKVLESIKESYSTEYKPRVIKYSRFSRRKKKPLEFNYY